MELFGQIIQNISVIVASILAIIAINAWKKEFIGKRKIELAEDVLAKFFQIKDSISFIRNPFSNSEEGKTRQKRDNEDERASELLDRAYVVFERYEKQKDVFNEFNIMKYKFMARFGKETDEIFIRVNKVINKIFIAGRMLGNHYWQRQGMVTMSDQQFKKHLDEMNKHEGIFWEMDIENDEIRKELEEIQQKLEQATREVFK
jgi:hypothetical protein